VPCASFEWNLANDGNRPKSGFPEMFALHESIFSCSLHRIPRLCRNWRVTSNWEDDRQLRGWPPIQETASNWGLFRHIIRYITERSDVAENPDSRPNGLCVLWDTHSKIPTDPLNGRCSMKLLEDRLSRSRGVAWSV
jgi:hypothetical protein